MVFYDEVVTDKGNTHRFSWLIGVTGLSPPTRYDFLKNLAEMHEDRDDIRDIKNEQYQARMYRGKKVSLGCLHGIQFLTTIETNQGKQEISTMILN